MDIGLSNRAIMPLPFTTPRAEVVPVPDAVGTLMPQAEFAVSSTANTEKTGEWNYEQNRYMSEEDARAIDELKERIEREIEYDATDKALIFRVVDTSNGEVIIQTPNEAMLRLRAFFREMGIDSTISSRETEGTPAEIPLELSTAPDTPAEAPVVPAGLPEMSLQLDMYKKAAAQLGR